jgi:glycosyltransferase involved in cell wall biosynthesis
MNEIFGNSKFILVLSQRDIKHPQAGGAEVYTHNALKELAKDITVVHLGMNHPNHKVDREIIDNIYYIRKGKSLLSTTFEGFRFYRKYKNQIITVIDHTNTHQFFTFLWCRCKRILFIHQFALEIWGYFFGKLPGKVFSFFEELLMRLSRGTTITVSNSTKQDLLDRGYKDIHVCTEGNYIRYNNLPDINEKKDYLIYVGRLVPYKRVEDAILLAHKLNKKLIIVGGGSKKYTQKLQTLINYLKADCEMLGYVKKEDKESLVKKAYMLVMPSIREGWGLVITESANLGTPSLVYPAQGVIEAVDYGRAGFLASEVSVDSLVKEFKKITPELYTQKRISAFEYSLKFTWEKTALEFKEIIRKILAARGIDYKTLKK